ncbi:hypothetical protein HZA39_01175 [Candidatus Peregrinibacteria bacterium]|nr:hypothetical protein [Candidatus Peregrinibacteria bacterium]
MTAVKNKHGKINLDKKLLKHWKSLDTKTKLNWLQDALYFGKLKKI